MYSPKIQEDLVRAMYRIKQQTGVAITRQVTDGETRKLIVAELRALAASDGNTDLQTLLSSSKDSKTLTFGVLTGKRI